MTHFNMLGNEETLHSVQLPLLEFMQVLVSPAGVCDNGAASTIGDNDWRGNSSSTQGKDSYPTLSCPLFFYFILLLFFFAVFCFFGPDLRLCAFPLDLDQARPGPSLGPNNDPSTTGR